MALSVIDFGIILFLLNQIKVYWPNLGIDAQDYLLVSVNLALCWTLASLMTGTYQVENIDRIKKIIIRSLLSGIIYLALVLLSMGLRHESTLPLGTLLSLSLASVVTIVIARMFMHRIYKVLRHMSPHRKNVIIIGNTPRGKELSRYFLTTTSLPVQYLGFFDNHIPTRLEDVPFHLGSLEGVKQYCLENNVNEIYYALDQQQQFFADLMQFADEHFIFLGIVPHLDGIDFSRRVDTLLFNDSRIPIIASRRVPLQLFENHQIKRAFDVIFSAIVLLFLSFTVFPVIALAIKLSSPGPVLFKQLRPGKNNKLFWCYKFRTMKVDSDQQKQATKNDSRITRVGAFLRKTSLDELPQFYNVLIGDMSVVGPRPNLLVHLQEYPKEIKEYTQRHWVTPGITGFAQVSGLRGETKETILMKKRVEHDLQYIENWSLELDMKIIGKTVVNMVKGEDKAY
ncbi:exopolysaccharide biosynthesis polyprenyl glycosylphosphotransferase [Cesiribacter sp. SM1]|uniref:exopolysaccharide biosynthesis polyprenyl glycosylphosphotransferase n=1 Tax=Cesiribacter sp. SM1 TaxID=2861196 RepID=UPI001CD6A0F2|nr:exopolysaccharide biosynthesis polyprenyl glycosylphosphotransferase [Cesiribacter sp. SM1]